MGMPRFFHMIVAILGIATLTPVVAKPVVQPPAVYSVNPKDPQAPSYPSLRRLGAGWLFFEDGDWKVEIGRELGGHCTMTGRKAAQSVSLMLMPFSGGVRFAVADPKLPTVLREVNDVRYGFDRKMWWGGEQRMTAAARTRGTIGAYMSVSAQSDRILNQFMVAQTFDFFINGQVFAIPLEGSAKAGRALLECQTYIAQERLQHGVDIKAAKAMPVPQARLSETSSETGFANFAMAGAWRIERDARDGTCTASLYFANGTFMTITEMPDGSAGALILSNPSWAFEAGKRYPLAVQFDDDPPIAVSLVPTANNWPTIFVGAALIDKQSIRSVWSKKMVQISVNSADSWYSLDGAAAAGKEVERCWALAGRAR